MKWEEKIKTYRDEMSIHSNEDKIVDTIHKSKEIFYLKEQKKLLTYREFLWIQFHMIQKKWCLLQLLVLLGTGITLPSVQEDFFIQRGLGVASVLFVILIIPELWKNQSNQCMEIEGASYYSLRQIYAARIFLLGIVDVVLLTGFCVLLRGRLHITLVSLLSQFFFPGLVTACICFGLLCNKKLVNEWISIALCIMWSAIWWLITASEKIYSMIKLPIWILFIEIAVLILGSMIYKTLHDCTRYWEECSGGTKND